MGRETSRNRKRKIERRRRTRKHLQRGGRVENIQEWINAVEQKFKEIAIANATNYKFSDLIDEKLRLPDMEKPDLLFDVESGRTRTVRDLRSEYKKIVVDMGNIIDANPTPQEFKEYIDTQVAPSAERDTILDIAVKYATALENTLRRLAEKDTIDSLGDQTKYPLFIWALMMNPPEKPVDLLPSEVPKEQVESELQQFSES